MTLTDYIDYAYRGGILTDSDGHQLADWADTLHDALLRIRGQSRDQAILKITDEALSAVGTEPPIEKRADFSNVIDIHMRNAER